jgi:hypothetical protein
MTIGEFSSLLAAIGGITSPIVIAMIARQTSVLKEVHKSTDGLSERNEAIARKLGIAEGTATGLREGREETK